MIAPSFIFTRLRQEQERVEAMRLFRKNTEAANTMKEDVDLAEAKQRVYRLAKELEAAAAELQAHAVVLTQKANELKEELNHERRERDGQ